MIKNIIIGASGFIGNSLLNLLKNQPFIGTYHNKFVEGLIKLDMSLKSDLESLFNKYAPKIVYMPAFIPKYIAKVIQ